ncbi:MAG: flavin reductase [Clostridia bacterium]|nr:flavin reductase [Clostridia bacterium]MBQ1942497.1 flavin reductase [Clostridia bacterium]MBQ5801438.1 flavin reductase [Clostridia bacterium]
MQNVKKITDSVFYVGANDRRIALFEGVYKVPKGVSYNSYLIKDEKTAVMDTVDQAVCDQFFENVAYALGGRTLDYLVVSHMEPDHSATVGKMLDRYPELTLILNRKTLVMLQGYLSGRDIEGRYILVEEGNVLPLGKHTLHFVMAPMVHWPEVMVAYDDYEKILFSADAFGSFGALNGAIYLDEADVGEEYFNEARRYYTNIVGKYGTQVQALLKKASGLSIEIICPLHGYAVRRNINDFVKKYQLWSSYTPEKQGVLVAYASVYGNTANAAEILAARLAARGVYTEVCDVSVTPADEVIANAFKLSHLVFASTTYNAGIFVKMNDVLHDLVAHNLQNRKVALIENGSWAPTAGGLMKDMLSTLKNVEFIGDTVTVRSALLKSQEAELDALAEAIAQTFTASEGGEAQETTAIDPSAFFKLSYGLFVLSAKDGKKDNGCIINTAQLLTDTPKRVTVSVNKANYTCDMIEKTGVCNISVLSESADFALFERFGFQSGRDVDKFAGLEGTFRTENGLLALKENVSAVISLKVVGTHDYGTHKIFVCEATEAKIVSGEQPATYDYYFKHIKPSPAPLDEDKKGFVCKICGYVYEGDTLPADYICPLCKHGAEDFEPLK